jgi:hypothetical protein
MAQKFYLRRLRLPHIGDPGKPESSVAGRRNNINL